MNIVFIQKSTGRGGAKNSLAESLTAMMDDGAFHPQVIVGEEGLFTERCTRIRVPFFTAELPEWRKFFERLRFPTAMKRLAILFRDQQIDWVISNEMWWGPHAATLARHLGCRSAVILRDGIATLPKAREYRLDDNDLILPVSSTIADALTVDPGLRPKIKVLFNSVSLPVARPDAVTDLDEKLRPFSNVKRWVLILGKVGARKNQADGVRLLRLLIDDGFDDLGLLLAGDIDPAYEPELNSVIADNQLPGRVAVIGNFDGLHALLDRAHVVVLPSLREGLPRSLVEAICVGKPAFSYPCEGVDDIFGRHRATFVSAESTPPSLHQIIHRAWNYPDVGAAAFSEVRTNVLERFSPKVHLASLKCRLEAPDQQATG